MATRGKTVMIDLDKERRLRLSFGAAADFEEETGESLFDPLTFSRPTAKKFVTLLWACLKAGGDKEITQEQVADLIDLEDLPAVETALSQLMDNQLPHAQKGSGTKNASS